MITQWLEIIAHVFVICKVEKISINLQGFYQNELANNQRTCIVHPAEMPHIWLDVFGGFLNIFQKQGKQTNTI